MTTNPKPEPIPPFDALTGDVIPVYRTERHIVLGDGLAQWWLNCDNALRLARALLDNVDAIDNADDNAEPRTVQP